MALPQNLESRMLTHENTDVSIPMNGGLVKIRIALIVGVLSVGSFQPLFGEDFKFKVTPEKPLYIE